jgi:hypothetical protein
MKVCRVGWGGSAAGCALILVAGNLANAAIIQMEMSGTITTVQDSLGLLPFAHLGDQVIYRFSYDSSTSDMDPTITGGVYSGIQASLRAGSQQLMVTDAPRIVIAHPNDYFDVSSHLSNSGLSPDLVQGYVYFRLSDQPNGDALTSTDLPLMPYDISLFSMREFHVSFLGPGGENGTLLYFVGAIDFFVPEPAAIILILPILLIRRHRKTCPSVR